MSSFPALPMEIFKTSIAESLHFKLTMPRLTSNGGIQKTTKLRVIRNLPSNLNRGIKRTFMRLPGEIRNEIYKHAMDDLPKGLMLYDGQIMLPFHNLQFVSKQISAEVIPFVRSHTCNAPMTVCIQNCNFDPFMTWLNAKSTEEQEILQTRSCTSSFVMELVCTTDSHESLWGPLLKYLGPRVYEDPICDLNIEYTRLDCVEGWVSDKKVACRWGHACFRKHGHPRGLEDMALLVRSLGESRDYHLGMVSEMKNILEAYMGPTDNPLSQHKH